MISAGHLLAEPAAGSPARQEYPISLVATGRVCLRSHLV